MEQFFIGRNKELRTLDALTDKKTASLVVVTGRRRIGKSRLIEKFTENKKCYSFSGLPPTKSTTSLDQKQEFARQLSEQLGLPAIQPNDWGDLLSALAKLTSKGRIIVVLDEISWMAHKDDTFLGKLKIVWDSHFKKNPKLILILCGSVSSWIEKNILSSTGFFGRVALKISLEELSLELCNKFLEHLGLSSTWSSYEKLMMLSVTGGIPWYIELINPKMSAIENIKQLCFQKDGILVDEFKYIFHDLFGRRGEIYKKIVQVLLEGPTEYLEIANKLKYRSGGPLSEYLNDLSISGFVKKEFGWNLKTGKRSSLCRYRLRDSYLKFYLKCIEPNLFKIEEGQFDDSISTLPGFATLMGLQLENLVLNNRNLLYKKLNISSQDIIHDAPYFQHKTTKQKGCQIDYLIQSKFQNLWVCEIKFSKNTINCDIIEEVQSKIDKLSLPKGLGCCPVLIHMGNISDTIYEKNYFTKIISLDDLLQGI